MIGELVHANVAIVAGFVLTITALSFGGETSPRALWEKDFEGDVKGSARSGTGLEACGCCILALTWRVVRREKASLAWEVGRCLVGDSSTFLWLVTRELGVGVRGANDGPSVDRRALHLEREL